MNERVIRLAPTILVAALAACSGQEPSNAATDTDRIAACDLVTPADVEAVTAAPIGEPDEYSSRSYSGGSSLMSSCVYEGGVVVRAWHPYLSGESRVDAWTAKVQAERDRAIASEKDPGL